MFLKRVRLCVVLSQGRITRHTFRLSLWPCFWRYQDRCCETRTLTSCELMGSVWLQFIFLWGRNRRNSFQKYCNILRRLIFFILFLAWVLLLSISYHCFVHFHTTIFKQWHSPTVSLWWRYPVCTRFDETVNYYLAKYEFAILVSDTIGELRSTSRVYSLLLDIALLVSVFFI